VATKFLAGGQGLLLGESRWALYPIKARCILSRMLGIGLAGRETWNSEEKVCQVGVR